LEEEEYCFSQNEIQGGHWAKDSVTIHPAIIIYKCQKCTDSGLPVIVDELIDMINNDHQNDCQAVHHFLLDCCLTPLSTIFQLYRGG